MKANGDTFYQVEAQTPEDGWRFVSEHRSKKVAIGKAEGLSRQHAWNTRVLAVSLTCVFCRSTKEPVK